MVCQQQMMEKRNVNGLSNIVVTRGMLSTVECSYKAYMQHIDKEKGEDQKKKSNSPEAEAIRKKVGSWH